jgi:4'-phosphopantetheinyl transferase
MRAIPELHLWFVDVENGGCDEYWQALSSHERHRAAALRSEQDRSRYVVAHGALRTILARYVGSHPGTLQFRVNAYGKPFLQHSSSPSLQFNLTHCGSSAVVAVTWNREIGVDLEAVRMPLHTSPMVWHYLHRDEVAALEPFDRDCVDAAFLRLWTAKEAFAKCVGLGVSCQFESFSVLSESWKRNWCLAAFRFPEGFIGAAVYPPPALALKAFRWSESGSEEVDFTGFYSPEVRIETRTDHSHLTDETLRSHPELQLGGFGRLIGCLSMHRRLAHLTLSNARGLTSNFPPSEPK